MTKLLFSYIEVIMWSFESHLGPWGFPADWLIDLETHCISFTRHYTTVQPVTLAPAPGTSLLMRMVLTLKKFEYHGVCRAPHGLSTTMFCPCSTMKLRPRFALWAALQPMASILLLSRSSRQWTIPLSSRTSSLTRMGWLIVGVSLPPTADLHQLLYVSGFPGWGKVDHAEIGLTLTAADGRIDEWHEGFLFSSGYHAHLDLMVAEPANLASEILIKLAADSDADTTAPAGISLLQTAVNLNVAGTMWQRRLAANINRESATDERKLRHALLNLRKWPDAAFCNCWDQVPEGHPYLLLIPQLQPALDNIGALHIFTDGSYYKTTQAAAWSFSVVLQLPGERYYRWGFTGGILDGCTSSLAAEAVGLAHAMCWLVSSIADTAYPVTLHGDATAVGYGAAGVQAMPKVQDISDLHLRALFQLCKSIFADLTFRHVPAHAGQLDNELVDSVAKSLALQQWAPFTDVPDIHDFLSASLLDWAWLLIEKEVNCNPEYPSLYEIIHGTGFHDQPTEQVDVFQQTPEVVEETAIAKVTLKVLTANVRTLKGVSSDPSLSDKIDLLARQFDDENYDVVALQETRCRDSFTTLKGNYLRLTAAANHGQGGVEIWFRQSGGLAASPFGPVRKEHCHVWHADHTFLGLECDHPLLSCDVVAVYAPQPSQSKDVISAWWSSVSTRLASRGKRDLVFLGDCNAKIGSVETSAIGPVGWTLEDLAGSCLRDLLARHNMILPSTFHCWHDGTSATFHSPSGGHTRLDYIAIPCGWQGGVKYSRISEVDLLNGVYDHSGVELCLEMSVHPRSTTVKQHRATYDRKAARQDVSTATSIAASIPVVSRHTGVDKHWSIVSNHCQRNLTHSFPKPRRQLRQLFFSDDTWTILNDRKDVQKDIRFLDRQESLLMVARCFRAWHTGKTVHSRTTDLSMIRQEKAFLLWVRQELAIRFRKARQEDLRLHREKWNKDFVGEVSSSCARRIYQALRPKRPVARNKGISTRTPLPELEIGNSSSGHREKMVRVWEKHFSMVETATQLDPVEFQKMAIPQRQPPVLKGADPHYIPTLAEFEAAIRQLNWRKAPGYDGIGSEMWQSDVTLVARRMYPLFLKTALRGQLPLQFRGGFLIPLHKHKGSISDPKSYRGILLQNTMAKAFAKCWRSRLVSCFSTVAAPFQYGCLRKKGVIEAHFPVRLHMQSCAHLKLSSGIIFVDIKSAYYSVIKEFFSTTRGDEHEALASLFYRLGLPRSALDDFVETVSSTNLLEDAAVPEVLGHIIQSTISASWFQIPGSSRVCVPSTGTRPGDPLADVLYAYVMSNILGEAYQEFAKTGLLTPWDEHSPGTTWADDTCLLLAGRAEEIDRKISVAYSTLQEIMIRHGLSPTYGPGKTAFLISYRGQDAAVHHKSRYGSEEPAVECMLEYTGSQLVDSVYTYKHLGSIVDGDYLLPEVRARGQSAMQAIKPLRRGCLANRNIPLSRRQQLLETLGMSIITYNAGTWRRLQSNEFEAWSSALVKLYGCVQPHQADGSYPHKTLEELTLDAGGLLPDALLHCCRLRLLKSLLGGGDALLSEMVRRAHDVAGSESWYACVEEALAWLQDTIGQSDDMSALLALTPWDLGGRHEHLARFLHRALRKAKTAHHDLLRAWVDLVDTDKLQRELLCGGGWTGPVHDAPVTTGYACRNCG